MDAPDRVTSDAEAALHRLLLVLLAVLVMAGLVPLFAAGIVYRFFHSFRVFALAGGGLVLAVLPGLLALRTARRTAPAEPLAASHALWGGAAAAILAALAAVTATAQTMVPSLVIQAQANTHAYALLQPIALVVFVIATALAVGRDAIGTAVRPPLVAPVIAAKCVAAGLVLSVWFLAGGTGPALPAGAWLALKSLFAAAAVGAAMLVLERAPLQRRVVLAWTAALAGCLNLLATMAVFARSAP